MKYPMLYRMLFPILFVFLLSTGSLASDTSQRFSAPDFALKDIDGISHTLSHYKGRPVILNFWASWCIECLEEMPSLEALYNSFSEKGLIVLGINIDRDLTTVRMALNKVHVSYPVLMDTNGDVFIHSYTVTKLPTTIFINREGHIVLTVSGGKNFNNMKIRTFVKGLISGEAQ